MDNLIKENRIGDSEVLEEQNSTVSEIPKVSVVIPVYNVEKYLARCIESVVDQTLKDIEIIIVNDGSTDDSPLIMKEYAGKDSRIKIIDKPNTGYGNSMNIGIASAAGEYIGIVESDDFIKKNMYESLYKLSKGGTVDLVKGNFFDYYDYDDKPPVVIINKERDMIADTKEPFVLRDDPQISWGHPSVWSAIYRREFLQKNNIVFKEAKGGGWVDNPFFYETLCKAESIMWTKKGYYYYYKLNPTSSSNMQGDPTLPFVRMLDNLDVLESNGFNDRKSKRCAYARALMYLTGALQDFDYEANEEIITAYAQRLMRRLDRDCITEDFNLQDQTKYFTYASPSKSIASTFPKILIYNWVPFDNPWNRGGGVTIYCRNVIEKILAQNPTVNIYFLSSGFAYDASKAKTYTRKMPNVFGDRVHQFEIVNSPVPAEQRYIFMNPSVALENEQLKGVFNEFLNKYGPFKAVHFNNIEGLSLDVLDLKQEHPETRFIYSIHNYVPMCVNGFYYMRHKHCNCSPDHTAEDCMHCTRMDMETNLTKEMYNRGTYAHDPKACISRKRWTNAFGFERLEISATTENILDFAKTATEKLNENCDDILAVSRRVYEIAKENGFDESKMSVSYIGTKVASVQCRRQAYEPQKGLKIIFLGSDINNEEKGYPFLLDSLSEMPARYASQIDIVLTLRQEEHAEIRTLLKNFRSIKIVQGYSHDDLPDLFKDCNLSLVPVLWEDNLPQIAIESVAYGVPVLASSAGGASELCSSDLFRFTAGSGEEMNSKIMHFVDDPKDLEEYWTHHNGLVTMEEHIASLLKYYGVENSDKLEISMEDYGYLINENEFLHKTLTEHVLTQASVRTIDDLKFRLGAANEENKKLKAELERIGEIGEMEQFKGKVTFQTDYDSVQGHVGAKLFSLTLEDFNYSDFYAEIKFIKLENMGVSTSDTLQISGTWCGDEGSKALIFHQMDWDKDDKPLKDWIYVYTEKNSVVFFVRYPGKACGYDYSILTLTSRADHNSVKFEHINQGFIWENELKPQGAINDLSDAAAQMPTADKEAQTGKKSIINSVKHRIKRTIAKDV